MDQPPWLDHRIDKDSMLTLESSTSRSFLVEDMRDTVYSTDVVKAFVTIARFCTMRQQPPGLRSDRRES
jgi:hypothetical protein